MDGVGGYDVMSVVLQIPKNLADDATARAPRPRATTTSSGIWDTAERLANTHDQRRRHRSRNSSDEAQVSRLGMPLVNEVVIPLRIKDKFNASEPCERRRQLRRAPWSIPSWPSCSTLIYGI